MQILLCLENPRAESAIVEYFATHGIDAQRAENLEHARGLVRFRRYDALVCDASFGGVEEALALAGEAKRRNRDIQTVVLATTPLERGEAAVLLVKPFPLADLLTACGV